VLLLVEGRSFDARPRVAHSNAAMVLRQNIGCQGICDLVRFSPGLVPEKNRLAGNRAIFTADLRHRRVDFQMPSNPLTDTTWILLLERICVHPSATPGNDGQTVS